MKRIYIVVGALLAAMSWTTVASAEPLRVKLDKYELLRLEKDAATVLIANPAIADVGIESTRLIIIIGRAPGETELVVLDDFGHEILKRPVVVVPTVDRNVTVHRGGVEATLSCAPRCIVIPNPGAGRAPPAGVGAAAAKEEDEKGGPSGPSSEDIAAAAAAAAAAAVSGKN